MAKKFREFIRDFTTIRLGWLFVVANLAVFLYLLGEMNRVSEFSKFSCDGNITSFGVVQTSSLFLVHAILNLPASFVEGLLSKILFWNHGNPCIHYNYDEYPFIFIGKFVIALMCQCMQWFLVGYLFEKTLFKDITESRK